MKKGSKAWIENSEVVAMFPTLVWKVQLQEELHRVINANILRALETEERSISELAPGGSWQSEHSLHEREELRELVGYIRDTARTVLGFLQIGYNDFEITGCWANVNAPGAAHQAHSHPNNFLSGAYYVQAQPGADTISFHDPRVQTGILRPPVTELTAENADQIEVKIQN